MSGEEMQVDRLAPAVVRFDAFEVDLQAGELRKAGRRIRIQEQPFRVLALLLERVGDAVTREELRATLWPADTFVDFDHGLNSAVARLREALGDSADGPRFIETIAKRGYRFIGPILPVATQHDEIAANGTGLKDRRIGSHHSRKVKIWIGAAMCFALFSAIGISALYRPHSESHLSRIEVVPLVGLRGFQATPAFSPDGTLVAFRQSDGAQNTGIYAVVVGGEKSIQLTHDPGDCCPTWSPQGDQIAFTRYSDNSISIYTVSALGGTEHRLYRGPAGMGAGLSWSPDGSSLAFSEGISSDPTRVRVSLLSLADSSVRPITSPPPSWLDHEAAFSPDGTQIAFVRSTVAGVSNDLFVMPATGGQPKRLTFDNRPIMGPPTWTSDSRELIFSSDRGATMGLWRVSVAGSTPRPVAGPMSAAKWPSIPAKGNTLVYEEWVSKFNIWQLDLKDPKHLAKSPTTLVSEKGDKMRPDFSPDGKKIAFESDRLGFWDIWTCDVGGTNCDRLTSLHGSAGRARWSPNGRYIAFEFHPNERGEIYMVEVPGGTPRLFPTIPGADNLSPSWSRDGKWLYFASKRGTEAFQIWKMPVQGGTPVRLTKNGGISPVESPDGQYLYYSKFEQGGVWRMTVQGGEETEVLSEVDGGGWPNWALGSNGIYFLRFGKFPHVSIDLFEFATGKILPLWTLEKEPGWGLSMASNGKSIAYVQNEFAESDIMLVKNFR
jgi:Tol biopolymer transport system component/DNA-binding winged helix-turn-helix (wHTH) protein